MQAVNRGLNRLSGNVYSFFVFWMINQVRLLLWSPRGPMKIWKWVWYRALNRPEVMWRRFYGSMAEEEQKSACQHSHLWWFTTSYLVAVILNSLIIRYRLYSCHMGKANSHLFKVADNQALLSVGDRWKWVCQFPRAKSDILKLHVSSDQLNITHTLRDRSQT